MRSYNKQQTVHLLPVPFEIGDVINSFLFIEIKTFIENKKKEIVKKFNNAITSRKNRNEEDADSQEHWSLCLISRDYDPYDYEADDIVEESQFQATNCRICGNYKVYQCNFKMAENIICKCSQI